MVDTKRTKKKKAGAKKRVRKERRFVPEQTYASTPIVVGGMVSALALGAGVFGQWFSENPPAYAPYLFAAGAIGLGAALWFGDSGAHPVRIGDAGIAIERGNEMSRLAWCDIERIYIDKGQLIAKTKSLSLSLPVAAHKTAVSWILSEGTRRVPDVMDVKRSEVDKLPAPKDTDGESVAIEGVQVAGRHCAQSDKPIAFERDARLCPVCSQVYLKEHVPPKCSSCEQDLGERAIEI
jgi:hypothetical protein